MMSFAPLAHLIQPSEFAIVLFGGFVIGACCIVFILVAANVKSFVVAANGYRPFFFGFVPIDAFVFAARGVRALGDIGKILAMTTNPKIRAAVVQPVSVDVIYMMFCRNGSHDYAVHTDKVPVGCVAIRPEPFITVQGLVVGIIHQCKSAITQCDFLGHISMNIFAKIREKCLKNRHLRQIIKRGNAQNFPMDSVGKSAFKLDYDGCGAFDYTNN